MTVAPTPPITGPDLSVRPDELTVRLAYADQVFATRTVPLMDTLAVLHYLVGVEMLMRLAHAVLTVPGRPYRSFHSKLHAGKYAKAPVGHPPPGSLPQALAALFLHTRCPRIYAGLPWWFGAVVVDLHGDESSCADLLTSARDAGITYAPVGPPRPLTDAELGPQTSLEDSERQMRSAAAETLARTAVLLPGPLALPELRRRWHRHPQEAADLALCMDQQTAKLERLLAAIETAVPGVAELAVRRQRACHDFLYRELAPHLRVEPQVAELLDNTPVAEDYAGLFRVLGMFKALTAALALPVRIRDVLTRYPSSNQECEQRWRDRVDAEGLPPEWTIACVRRILSVAHS